jgi:ankyrin repeat protein
LATIGSNLVVCGSEREEITNVRMIISVVLGTVAFAQANLPPAADLKVDFIKDVEPVLAQKCYSCHGAEVQQAGLRLDRRQNALRGGDYGPVIIPGKSAESKLIRRLVSGDGGLQMPPTGPLASEEIGVLRAWIDQGADFRLEVQEEAVEKPADPKITAFITAARSGDTRAVKKLIAGSPDLVSARDRAGSTPLHHAAAFGSFAVMELLIDKGADVNAVNKRKSTPLFWAIHDEAKVRLLLDRGADIHATTMDGRSLVYQAATMGNANGLLRLLLERGAAPDAKLLTGNTPLMAAAARADIQAMKMLIAKKADLNARNSAGATALMAAASTGDVRAVQYLIDLGADVNARTKQNETALGDAATAGDAATVRLLLDRGAEVGVQNIRGYSALHFAAGSDAMPVEVVRMLLTKGEEENAKADGETPADLAAKRGDSPVARLLGVPGKDRDAHRAAPVPGHSDHGRSVATAVAPALALLEKQSHNFIRIGGCNSCHAQDLPSAAAALARERGLPAPKAIPQLPPHMNANTTERLLDLNAVGLSTVLWELFDSGFNRVPGDHYTDAAVRYVKALQTNAGDWLIREGRRPPMNAGRHQATALATFALSHYGRPEDAAENGRAVSRARAWLEAFRGTNTQDRAFRLMGLAWSNASVASISSAVQELAGTQRAGGGWSQLPAMGADAYATGQALYALGAAGKMPQTDPVFKKGVQYLLGTQNEDGSWHVRTRSIWLQPYFESGFPHGHDQWISAAGTAWAVMALSLTAEPKLISNKLD